MHLHRFALPLISGPPVPCLLALPLRARIRTLPKSKAPFAPHPPSLPYPSHPTPPTPPYTPPRPPTAAARPPTAAAAPPATPAPPLPSHAVWRLRALPPLRCCACEQCPMRYISSVFTPCMHARARPSPFRSIHLAASYGHRLGRRKPPHTPRRHIVAPPIPSP